MSAIVNRIRAFADRAKRDTGGNMSVIVALAAGAILIAAGVAVDSLGVTRLKGDLQDSLDAAVLASTHQNHKDLKDTEEFITDRLSAYPGIMVDVRDDNGEMVATARGTYTKVMGFTSGGREMPVVATSGTYTTNIRPVEVALVTDLTHSMTVNLPDGGRRVDGLYAASDSLFGALGYDRRTGTSAYDAVRLSLVTFSRYVRLPAAQLDAAWVDKSRVPDPSSWDGCLGTTEPVAKTSPDLSPIDQVPAIPRVPGIAQMGHCEGVMVPPTQDIGSVRAALRGVEVNGDTHLPEGIRWGWRMLSPSVPFPNEVATEPGVRRALVVMTDGVSNTFPDLDGFHRTGVQMREHYLATTGSGTPYSVSERSRTNVREMCTSIKNAGIEIHMVSYTINKDSKSHYYEMLRDCATSAETFYDAQNGEQIAQAFTDIGRDLNPVRLTR